VAEIGASVSVELADGDELYRRLAPHHVRDDGTVNSSAFKRGKGFDPSISVDLARLTATPQDAIRTRPHFGLGMLRVADVRAIGLTVRHDPVPDNPAHCLIEGLTSKVVARHLASLVRVLLFPSALSVDHESVNE
jgi:hypothetical protein